MSAKCLAAPKPTAPPKLYREGETSGSSHGTAQAGKTGWELTWGGKAVVSNKMVESVKKSPEMLGEVLSLDPSIRVHYEPGLSPKKFAQPLLRSPHGTVAILEMHDGTVHSGLLEFYPFLSRGLILRIVRGVDHESVDVGPLSNYVSRIVRLDAALYEIVVDVENPSETFNRLRFRTNCGQTPGVADSDRSWRFLPSVGTWVSDRPAWQDSSECEIAISSCLKFLAAFEYVAAHFCPLTAYGEAEITDALASAAVQGNATSSGGSVQGATAIGAFAIGAIESTGRGAGQLIKMTSSGVGKALGTIGDGMVRAEIGVRGSGERKASNTEVHSAEVIRRGCSKVHKGAQYVTGAVMEPIRLFGKTVADKTNLSQPQQPLIQDGLRVINATGNAWKHLWRGIHDGLGTMGSAVVDVAVKRSHARYGAQYVEDVTKRHIEAAGLIGRASLHTAHIATYGPGDFCGDLTQEGFDLGLNKMQYLVGPVIMQGPLLVMRPPRQTQWRRRYVVIRSWSIVIYRSPEHFGGILTDSGERPWIIPTNNLSAWPYWDAKEQRLELVTRDMTPYFFRTDADMIWAQERTQKEMGKAESPPRSSSHPNCQSKLKSVNDRLRSYCPRGERPALLVDRSGGCRLCSYEELPMLQAFFGALKTADGQSKIRVLVLPVPVQKALKWVTKSTEISKIWEKKLQHCVVRVEKEACSDLGGQAISEVDALMERSQKGSWVPLLFSITGVENMGCDDFQCSVVPVLPSGTEVYTEIKEVKLHAGPAVRIGETIDIRFAASLRVHLKSTSLISNLHHRVESRGNLSYSAEFPLPPEGISALDPLELTVGLQAGGGDRCKGRISVRIEKFSGTGTEH